MYESLDDLWQRLPYEATRCEFDDDSEWAAYAARWYEPEFDSMEDFIHFCFAYSSVMQFVIPNLRQLAAGSQLYRDETAEWYVPTDNPLAIAKTRLQEFGTQALDATHWMASNLSFIHIPWLSDREHDQSLILPSDKFPELCSFGSKGYLTIFAVNF